MKFSTKLIITATVGILAVWGFAEASNAWHRRISEYEARVQDALSQNEKNKSLADSLFGEATKLRLANDSLAHQTAKVDTVLDIRIREVRSEPIPDTCAPFVAQRDSIIDAVVVQRESWKQAYGQEVIMAGMLEASRNVLAMSNDSLIAVLKARPKPHPWWLPSLGVGPFVGVCTPSSVCAGVGVTLSWEIR